MTLRSKYDLAHCAIINMENKKKLKVGIVYHYFAHVN
jgi:hypothetical protein